MKKIVLITTLILLSISLTSCWKHVEPRNVGIKVKTLGNNKGVQPVTLPVGRYWVGPYWKLYTYPTNVHIYPFTAGQDEGSEVDEAMKFQDKDGLMLSCDIAVAAQVDPKLVPTTFQMYGGNMETIIKNYVKQDLLNAFITFASRYKGEQLYSDLKMPMMHYVDSIVTNRYAPTGVIITDVAYKSAIRLPQNVMDAINQKIQATQIALQKEQEVMQAEADAKKAVAKANGEASANIALAQGEATALLTKAKAQAQANTLINATLTPNLIQYQYVLNWDGKTPTYLGAGSVLPPIFPNK